VLAILLPGLFATLSLAIPARRASVGFDRCGGGRSPA
jgi:hypothetical protein